MSNHHKIVSQVRKASQLSSALGVSHVKHFTPPVLSYPQAFQILQHGEEVIGHYKKTEQPGDNQEDAKMNLMRSEMICSPLPAKRWEQKVDTRKGVSLSVVEERSRS